MDLINKTIKSLQEKGYNVISVQNGAEALEKIKFLIPDSSSVYNGSSVTLDQIGFVEFLKSKNHKWVNLHEKVLANEIDRKTASISDFYLGSVHALSSDGQMLIASNTGSQIPSLVFNSQNLILVISTKKIVEDLNSAFKRLDEVVLPQENERMKGLYGIPSNISKILIFRDENKMMGRKINIILVDENLGF